MYVINSSILLLGSGRWEHVYSSGGAKEPAQPHTLLNRGIQNGIGLLREAVALEGCWPVLPLSLCHFSGTSKFT